MKKSITGIGGALGLMLLILDSKTAISGTQEGIKLCLQTVIPSLFPFFVMSGLVNQCFVGRPIILLRPVGMLCGIPRGAESLFLLGLLGGYPVGAKNIIDAENSGAINQSDARRMMGFCSNAGPAFIFGMAGSLFTRRYIHWMLWLIHILSAIIVGCVLPGRSYASCTLPKKQGATFIETAGNSSHTMANVCLWVVLFRVLISFIKRWFLFILPIEIQVLIIGHTELSNGVIALQSIECEGLRFILCAAMLSIGGICVAIQTVSISGDLGTGYYFPGKILHGCISILVAYFLQFALFSGDSIYSAPAYWIPIIALSIAAVMLIIYPIKNNSRNLSKSYV